MKVHYDAESDILVIILRDQPPSNAIAGSDVPVGTVVDRDKL
jgi:uncharacterized protein YuzE